MPIIGDITQCQQISVLKDRYSEITKGSFLSAYYDESYWASPNGLGYLEGSVPRTLTRVINVKNDPTHVEYKPLYTDAPIKITNANLKSFV